MQEPFSLYKVLEEEMLLIYDNDETALKKTAWKGYAAKVELLRQQSAQLDKHVSENV